MKTRIWLATTLVLALAFLGQVAVYQAQRTANTMHASWTFHPKSLREARNRAQSIVLAEVVSVERGEDLVTAAPGEPNGVDRIPTQRVTLNVLKAYRGLTKQGDQLTVFQTGGTVLPPAPAQGAKEPSTDVQQFIMEGDPLYQAGEQYLLMLEPGPKNMLRTISPEGRYRQEKNGALTPMIDGAVAREISGKKLDSLEQTLRATGNQ